MWETWWKIPIKRSLENLDLATKISKYLPHLDNYGTILTVSNVNWNASLIFLFWIFSGNLCSIFKNYQTSLYCTSKRSLCSDLILGQSNFLYAFVIPKKFEVWTTSKKSLNHTWSFSHCHFNCKFWYLVRKIPNSNNIK